MSPRNIASATLRHTHHIPDRILGSKRIGRHDLAQFQAIALLFDCQMVFVGNSEFPPEDDGNGDLPFLCNFNNFINLLSLNSNPLKTLFTFSSTIFNLSDAALKFILSLKNIPSLKSKQLVVSVSTTALSE